LQVAGVLEGSAEEEGCVVQALAGAGGCFGAGGGVAVEVKGEFVFGGAA
jgi:hypothetical protein